MCNKKLVFGLFSVLIAASMGIAQVSVVHGQNYFFDMHIYATEGVSEMVEYFKPYLDAIGINAIFTQQEFVFVDEMKLNTKSYADGGWDVLLLDLRMRPDPSFVAKWYHSRNIRPYGYGNFVSYKNGWVDALIDEGVRETNVTKRTDIYQRLMGILYDELPILPFYAMEILQVFGPNVEGADKFVAWSGVISDPIYHARLLHLTEGDTFRMGINFLSPSFIPCFEWSYDRAMLGTLVTTGPDYAVMPELAKSWNVSEDGLTITFSLREDAQWSDGVPFTSEDVKFTFDSEMDPELGAIMQTFWQDMISSVEAPDDHTVVVHLKYSAVYPFLDALSMEASSEMMPAHVLKDLPFAEWKTSDYNLQAGALPSNGPYKVIEKVGAGEEITYERNELFYGWGEGDTQAFEDAPKYVVYEYIPEKPTALVALEAGELEWLTNWYSFQTDIPHLKELANTKGVQVLTGPYSYGDCFYFNLNNPILNNMWVRKAIAYALPVEQFIHDILNEVNNATSLPIPKGHWATPSGVQDPYPYDVDKAKESMEKAGFKYATLEAAPSPVPIYIACVAGGLAAGVVGTFVLMRRRGKKET